MPLNRLSHLIKDIKLVEGV